MSNTHTVTITRQCASVLFHHLQHIEDDAALLEIFEDDGRFDEDALIKARNFWKEILVDADIAGQVTVVFDCHVQTALLQELVEGNTYFVCGELDEPTFKRTARLFEKQLEEIGAPAEFPKPLPRK